MSALMTDKVLKIDGSTGEGGGQIIRTALALSMLTGTPIEISNIRAGRAKPGLMRQHLMCVRASQEIANAEVSGAHLGSLAFKFTPKEIVSGDYTFDIGSAGSTSLVLQTILPALLFANTEGAANINSHGISTVTIKGGTHNPFSPTTDFLQQAFIPAVAKLGMQVEIELKQAGFAPIGGGEIAVTVQPFLRRADAPPFKLTKRGALQGVTLVASNLNLDHDICQRELASAQASLVAAGIDTSLLTSKSSKLRGIGEGNTCYAVIEHKLAGDVDSDADSETRSSHLHVEVFTLLGEKRTSAEKMGNRLAGLVKRYLLQSDALVDEYLTDQLLLPLALSGGGEFSTRMISQHTETQAWLIEQFLPVEISFERIGENKTLVKVVC